MEPSQAENLVQLIQLIRASRDLWYLNEAPELSERLYKGLSGEALGKEALKQSTSKDVETKRKVALAFEYVLIKQKFENDDDARETIEWLLQNEPSLLNLTMDVANVRLNYINQCIEQQKLLVPKEMDKIVLDRYAHSYDNLIFYDKPLVTLLHEREGKCDIHTIKDETGALMGHRQMGNAGVGIAEGLFSIMPYTEDFKGSRGKACGYIRGKQTDPNIICTLSVPLCHYVTQRYIHMRIWEAFKTSKIPIDDTSLFSEATFEFFS